VNNSNAQRSKLIAAALWLTNVIIVSSAALYIYWFQIGIYLLGNAWKDNSTPEMAAVNFVNLTVGLAAIIGSFLYKLKFAYFALLTELVLAFILIALF